MRHAKIIYMILGGLFLSGCQSIFMLDEPNYVISGTPVAGVPLGMEEEAVMGNAIGRTISVDYDPASGAFLKATQVMVGETVYWQNGRTGHWGYFCPLRDGHTRYDGNYCREFMSTFCINGQIKRMYSMACRRPDGTWYSSN